MSLLPIFNPIASVYRFDNLTFQKSESVPLRSNYSIDVHPSGTNLFLAHEDSQAIEPWSLTDWDIGGTTKGTNISISPNGSRFLGRGLQFGPDGTTAFIGASDYIEQHNFSTAYGGTATYDSELLGPAGGLSSFTVVDSGTKIIAQNDEKFYSTTLSAAWDLSSNDGWSLAQLDLSGTYTALAGFTVGRSGRQLIICEVFASGGDRNLHEYQLSTPNDVSTASFVRTYDYTADGSGNLDDVVYGDSGRVIFAVGATNLRQHSTVG